mmetsp:Transcript_3833/g.5953  ORF Transcript_3833/g.5953 Transcript_3833/m.5953 type:complete len:245 (+) Transcript_3833:269-1003(+)
MTTREADTRVMTRSQTKHGLGAARLGERRPEDAFEQEAKEEDEQIANDDESDGDSFENTRFDGTEVVRGIFFGGESCAHDSNGRLAHGITHVLSLLTKFEQSCVFDNDMVMSGHWKVFRIEDYPTADLLTLLDDCVDFVNDALGSKGVVCVHSLEGQSRSVCVCVAYLIKTLGMTLRSAYDLVKSHKPDVKINRGFWRQMIAYEEHVRGCASICEEDCPGAIIFEKEDLSKIIVRFRKKKGGRE